LWIRLRLQAIAISAGDQLSRGGGIASMLTALRAEHL